MRKESHEERAQKLLGRLERPKNTRPYQRPFFIEITGSPDAGKSTIIDILDPFFRRQGYRVYTPQEGAEAIRHIPRNTHLYNVRTGLEALIKLIDTSVNPNYDLVIFDRCIYDAYAWQMYWHKKNDISTKKRNILQDFFIFETWQNWIDVAFFVVTTAQEAIKRDQKVSLTQKFGSTTNPESIENLIEIFKDVHHIFKLWENAFLVDTTGLSRQKMSKVVLGKALNAMEKRFNNKN